MSDAVVSVRYLGLIRRPCPIALIGITTKIMTASKVVPRSGMNVMVEVARVFDSLCSFGRQRLTTHGGGLPCRFSQCRCSAMAGTVPCASAKRATRPSEPPTSKQQTSTHTKHAITPPIWHRLTMRLRRWNRAKKMHLFRTAK
jgi:hypothetical protein